MHKTDCHYKGNEHADGKVFALTLLLLKPRIRYKHEIHQTMLLHVREAMETDMKNVIPVNMPRHVGHILPFHSLPRLLKMFSAKKKSIKVLSDLKYFCIYII